MDAETFAAVIGLVSVYVVAFKLLKPKPKKQVFEYTTELSDQIEKVAYINNKIKEWEQLQQEIRLSDEHHHKAINLSWTTTAGHEKNCSSWIGDGGRSEEKMLLLSQENIEQLIEQLSIEIPKLTSKSREVKLLPCRHFPTEPKSRSHVYNIDKTI